MPRAASGLELDEAVVAAALQSLEAFVRKDAATLDVAFGLSRGPGERDPRTRASLAERDRLLREAAARFYAGMTAAEAARQIAARLSVYASAAWPRERKVSACPPRHAGRVEALLWEVLRAEPRTLSPERIEKVIRPGAGML
jgi:hypothetical protein